MYSMSYNSKLYSLRWQILSRDNFTCHYCGQQAPNVILHVDHRIPKTLGGEDTEDNLVTSCSACNIGKNVSTLSFDRVSGKVTSKRKGYSPLAEAVLLFLTSNGKASTKEIVKATGFHRVNICNFLNHSEQIVRLKNKGNLRYWVIKR